MNNMPPSYVPPPTPIRRGPNCWLIGGVTCLVIVVLAVIACVAMVGSFLHSKGGRQFSQSFGSVVQSAATAQTCIQNMRAIRDAIGRYHNHTGHYPDSLQELVPVYLPNQTILHCPLDSNSDPSHITYVYAKPTDSTPDSAPLLTFNWQMGMSMMGQTQTRQMTYVLTFGGQMIQKEGGQVTTYSAPQ